MLISYKPISFNKPISQSSIIPNNSTSFIQPKTIQSIRFGFKSSKINDVDEILKTLPPVLTSLKNLPHDALLCIYQGTFDPVQNGHLETLRHAEVLMKKLAQEKGLSQYFIIVIPNTKPNHKLNATPLEYRVNMLRLGLRGMSKNIYICTPPLHRDAILEKVMETALPDYKDRLKNIYFLRGTDSLEFLLRDRREEPRTYNYIHQVRPGANTEKLNQLLQEQKIKPITLIESTPEVSSTELRQVIRKNNIKLAKSMTPSLVLAYMNKHRIYSQRKNNLLTVLKNKWGRLVIRLANTNKMMRKLVTFFMSIK